MKSDSSYSSMQWMIKIHMGSGEGEQVHDRKCLRNHVWLWKTNRNSWRLEGDCWGEHTLHLSYNPPKYIPFWQRHKMGYWARQNRTSTAVLRAAPNVSGSLLSITSTQRLKKIVTSSLFKATAHVSIYSNSSIRFSPKCKNSQKQRSRRIKKKNGAKHLLLNCDINFTQSYMQSFYTIFLFCLFFKKRNPSNTRTKTTENLLGCNPAWAINSEGGMARVN